VSGQTAMPSGEHIHYVGFAGGNITPWTDPLFQQQLILYDLQGRIYGMYVGRGATTGAGVEFYTYPGAPHTHQISTATSSTSTTHSHSVPAHTHSVSQTTSSVSTEHTHTIPNHAHDIEYGIFEGSMPPAAQRQVRVFINGTERTSALGGPWSADVELDITPYLVDQNGVVRQQSNTIEIRAGALMDVEVTLRCLVTITQLVPV
jgi:hypothetical protein